MVLNVRDLKIEIQKFEGIAEIQEHNGNVYVASNYREDAKKLKKALKLIQEVNNRT